MKVWVDDSGNFPKLFMEQNGNTYLLQVSDKNPKRAWARYFELCESIVTMTRTRPDCNKD